jgi:hypothetical protein
MVNDKPGPRPNNVSKNRLVGWLVSYQMSDKGSFYEIRSGRTIISFDKASQERVIAVAEPGVSSPHLALSASPKHRVMILDIFSDRGSYVTKGNSGNERKVDGPTEVEHGDWLRIGDNTRFQVCLIDGPGR